MMKLFYPDWKGKCKAVFIPTSDEIYQKNLTVINEISRDTGYKFNIKKTYCIAIYWQQKPKIEIKKYSL